MEPRDSSSLICSMLGIQAKPGRMGKNDLLRKFKLGRRVSTAGGIRLQSTLELISESKRLSKRINASILKQYLFCMICNDYFVHPVVTSCRHTFCEKCIIEFAEKYGRCFQCDSDITRAQIHESKSIETSVGHFVAELNTEYRRNYQSKVQQHTSWKKSREPTSLNLGDLVDIYGLDGELRKGKIAQVIPNYNHASTLRVVDTEDSSWDEWICQNSSRLFLPGSLQMTDCDSGFLKDTPKVEQPQRQLQANQSDVLQRIFRAVQTLLNGPSQESRPSLQ
jgi:hypothetical protein